MRSMTHSSQAVEFQLNSRTVCAEAGETILQAAIRNGVDIPHLCYKPGYRTDGNCRACVVEIDGERLLAPACCRYPSEGMEVKSNSERAEHSQRLVLELLLADMPDDRYTLDSELD
ncbi:MAG: 2Fe-2S iron-sulfur cluster binding domain-containing protein, partial [Burkholderiales bacterium]|nr:2Fe-2S iron-sulfur cluster binding domain-containing protein [Burkholderiales bacterium]